MHRGAIFTLWLASLAGAFYLGLRWQAPPEGVTPVADVSESGPYPLAATSSTAGLGSEATAPEGALERAQALIRDGDPRAARPLIEAHLDAHHLDADARFLLSDVLQMQGESDRALDPLFEVLAYPETPEQAERARARVSLLVNARTQQLINAQDLAGLVRFYQGLVDAEPGFDGHRLELARWLGRSGRIDEAERVLSEVGLVGIGPAEREAVAGELVAARELLPLERERDALYSKVLVGRAELRLLVDTGASMTGISRAALARLGARRTDRRVLVETANGSIELPVYRLRDVDIGPRRIESLDVLALDSVPGAADGLLGMDVLGGLPKSVGTPRIEG